MIRESKLNLLSFSLICRKPIFLCRSLMRYAQNLVSDGTYLAGVSFASSYECNFNCRHCYAQNFRKTDRKPLSLLEKKNILWESIEEGAVSFDFVGGEISLQNDFEELVKACKPYMTYISLTTNGYSFDIEKLKRFKKCGVDKLNVSIDSGIESEHDSFRNKKGSYERCIQTLQLCKKVGIRPAIIMTVTKNYTKSEGFKSMVEFAIRNKILLVFTPAIPFGNWENNLDIMVTEDDIREMGRLHSLYPFLTRDNFINMGKKGCPAFKQIVYITEYGDVLPCAYTHIAFGNLRTEHLSAIRERALSIDYFRKYHTCCLAAEDRSFIERYLSKNYNAKSYPINYSDIFESHQSLFSSKGMRRNIKKVFVNCAICGSSDYEPVAHGHEHEYNDTTDDILFVVKCKDCGFTYLNPRPDTTEFETIYPKNYYCYTDLSSQTLDKGNRLFGLKQKLIGEIGFPKRIRRLLNNYSLENKISVIDIGCGNGSALDIFKKIGNGQIDTCGIDISDSAIQVTRKKGHTVYKGDFLEMDLPDSAFDIVYSSNVIEHVADPSIFMKKVACILKPSGLFLCETPNIASIDAEFFKKSGHWGGYHFPRHWTFFTPAAIQKLGNKFGLMTLEVKYFPVPIFWIWTFHSIIFGITKNKRIADTFFPLVENRGNFLFSFILKANFTLWDYAILAFTGKTALMYVLLKKDSNNSPALKHSL